MPLVIGTRGSRLALAQAERVCRLLAAREVDVETALIRTRGDEETGVPLHEIGGQGLFVKALDDAILRGEIDCAVHSMKDIPVKRPEGLTTVAVLGRDSPADFLALSTAMDQATIVGTSSMRRRAQILRHDSSLDVRPLRGNVDTRIRRLLAGDFHAIVLAEAGLQRMDIRLRGFRLPPEKFVPTANQGVIAVVCRDEPWPRIPLSSLDHGPSGRSSGSWAPGASRPSGSTAGRGTSSPRSSPWTGSGPRRWRRRSPTWMPPGPAGDSLRKRQRTSSQRPGPSPG
jgi:hydroxymethylbilane synthase